MKAFISYSYQDRTTAARIKKVLGDFEIEAFLAHDDIQVSQEWRNHIINDLKISQIFIPLLSQAFRASDWAPQELGIASIRRGVLIVPLSLDETIPFGFISHLQGRRLPKVGMEVATPLALVIDPIVQRFPQELIPHAITRLATSRGWRYSEEIMSLLVPHFPKLTDSQVHAITEAAISNGEIWNAADCAKKYLPKFIEINASRIPSQKLEVLRFQVENQQWYPKQGAAQQTHCTVLPPACGAE
jgi:TIR domain-containing protein